MIILLCLTAGFLLRLYGAAAVPLVLDEKDILKSLPAFNGEESISAGSALTHNPPFVPYLLQLSVSIGGKNPVAIRFPGVLLGTLTLFVLYLLVKKHVNTKTALWALFFATFSQFFIGFSRLVKPDGILLFFIVCTLFFVERARATHQKYHLWGVGFSMGLGLLVKFNIITLWPVILYYLFIDPANRKRFSLNDLILVHSLIFLCLFPYLLWNIQNSFVDYSVKTDRIEYFSISLVPTALFLGEIFIFNMPEFSSEYISKICSIEYPFFNWIPGLICMAGAVYFLFKNTKNSFLTFLKWIFYFNFLFFSFVRPKTGGGYHFHLDNFWWAVVLVIPGLILGSAMIVELLGRFPRARYLMPFLIIYCVMNAFSFVFYPANCWVPSPGLKVRELCLIEKRYQKDGDALMAQKVHRYLLKHFPEESDCGHYYFQMSN
ncbi:MAG: glycosyltransferase family 39 protein [Candidatus Omnitrophota bacterium]|jgi:4-amino-4-deoxy-L-arabinose transferase-like glycosyltransferase